MARKLFWCLILPNTETDLCVYVYTIVLVGNSHERIAVTATQLPFRGSVKCISNVIISNTILHAVLEITSLG